jgi:hypothetical protein
VLIYAKKLAGTKKCCYICSVERQNIVRDGAVGSSSGS